MHFGWKRIIALGLIAITLVVIFKFVDNLGFKIRSTSPSFDNIGSLTPFTDIVFNKDLDASATKVSSSPGWVVIGQDVQKNILRILYQKPLVVGSTYKVTVYARIEGGNNEVAKTYSFSVKNIPFEKLTKEQQKYLTQSQNRGAFQDPILANLPHITPEFELAGSVDNSVSPPNLKLQATLYMTQADMSDQVSVEAQHKQSVLEYIRSLGLSPDKYKIDFIDSLP